MAKSFKSENDLRSFLMQKCKVAIAETEKKIYADIKSTLAKFYQEFTPEEYIRTNQLLHSLVKSYVKEVGNGYVAEVYFDASMLNYDQGMMRLKHTSERGKYGWATWTGDTVLDVAMTGGTDGLPHGGYAAGTAVWPVSLEKIGNVWEVLEQKLRAQGIPIVKG